MKLVALICVVFVASALAQVQPEIQSNGEIAESPYYCTIRRVGDFLEVYGSGTIISPLHVLTAGGLVVKASGDLLVGVGSNRLSLLLFYAVDSINIHPNFMNADKSYNFAILTLEHALTFTSTVQPIALPPLGIDGPRYNEQGRISTFAGGSVLKHTFQRVVDDDACPIYRINPEDRSSFCAAQDESDLENCLYKEMGAGFILQVFGVDTIVGLTSWGGICSSGAESFVYARISTGREWINEITGL